MNIKLELLKTVASEFERRGFIFSRRRDSYNRRIKFVGVIGEVQVMLEADYYDFSINVFLDGKSRHEFDVHQDNIDTKVSSVINECMNLTYS